MTTRLEIEALIREQSAVKGSLDAALHHVHDFILSRDICCSAVDVFPSHHLAGAVHRLCRCRGMIQEVQPEVSLFCAYKQHFFYPSAVPSVSPCSPGEDAVEFLDAVSLYVIPVPGNDHFYTVDDTFQNSAEAARATSSPSFPPAETQGERKRRDREGVSALYVSDTVTEHASGCRRYNDEDSTRIHKISKTGDGAKAGSNVDTLSSSVHSTIPGPSLNFPHPSQHPQLQTACIVTVLLPPASPASLSSGGEGDRRRNPFRINDVFDFYGFQHFPDDQLAAGEEDDFLRFSAWNAAELSKGLVSRLLCLAYSPVCSVHLSSVISASNGYTTAVAAQRTFALRYLCECLTDGDELVAEYLLLHLCSRVSVHSDVLPVGDLPLLITSPQLRAEAWSQQLRRIVPVGEIFLNSATLAGQKPLTPRYNNELNYLQSGVLQVANGSHVTFDCTALGTQNVAWYEGVFSLVHKQLLLLDYPYQTLELPVDVAVLALHAAPDMAALHPLFQFALCLKWQPTSAPAASANLSPEKDAAQGSTDSAAANVRSYLTAVRHLPERRDEMDESVSAQASAALLEMTRDIPGWHNHDPLLHNNSFSVATALMRTHAASHGRSNFTADDIVAVRRLESARVARLRNEGFE